MKDKTRIFIGNGLAAVMDFGIGTVLATGIAEWYEVALPWYAIFFGGVLALIPDFDLLPSVISGVSPAFDHHQTLLHRPLLILPIVLVGMFLLGGTIWVLIAGACVFAHYLHDTNFMNTDHGIAWFWPFSHKNWSIFGPYRPMLPIANSHYEWLNRYWLRPSPLSIREICIGLVCFSISLRLVNCSYSSILCLWLIAGILLYGFWRYSSQN